MDLCTARIGCSHINCGCVLAQTFRQRPTLQKWNGKPHTKQAACTSTWEKCIHFAVRSTLHALSTRTSTVYTVDVIWFLGVPEMWLNHKPYTNWSVLCILILIYMTCFNRRNSNDVILSGKTHVRSDRANDQLITPFICTCCETCVCEMTTSLVPRLRISESCLSSENL